MNHPRLETRLLKRKLEKLLREAAGDPAPVAPAPEPPAPPPADPTTPDASMPVDASAGSTNDPGATGAVPPADGSAPMTDPSGGGAMGGGGGGVGADGTTPDGTDGTDPATDPMAGGGVDNRFAVSGGGGGGGSSGGMDSSSDTTIGGEEGGEGEAGVEDSEPPANPVEDAKTILVALASEPPSSKNDPLALVKATKGLIQNGFTTKEQVTDLIDQLSQEETPQLKELAERLRLFMTITTNRNTPKGTSSPMKPPVTAKPSSTTPDTDTGLTALQESTLKELVTETVSRIISENSSYTAMRKLAIQAQETSLDFEKNIVTLLGIVEPDMLDGTARKVYHQAAEGMKQRMVDAVLSAAQQIARLPKKDDGKQQ